jgi:hypothetical protein
MKMKGEMVKIGRIQRPWKAGWTGHTEDSILLAQNDLQAGAEDVQLQFKFWGHP